MNLHLTQSSVYSLKEIHGRAKDGLAYIDRLKAVAETNTYEAEEASINLPFDDQLIQMVTDLASKKVSPSLRYIFLVGIGGSNLGTKAVYDALYSYKDVVQEDRPKVIFIDTINEAVLRFVLQQLIPTIHNSEEYLLISISKSGGTTETIANTEVLMSSLTEQLGNPRERTVVITDTDSRFWQAAEAAQCATLPIPNRVGGRYSVLSAVGLFPLLALGVDIEAFRQGARDMRARCLQENVDENPALLSAALSSLAYEDGKRIHDTFVFNSELESLGKWYRQLLGESIGKEHDRSGNEVHTGITPTVSVGSTDLHSVGQLYLGGPKDKFTTFVHAAQAERSLAVSTNRVFPTTVNMIDGKQMAQISKAILGGVQVAYRKRELPYAEITLDAISPFELGAFMQFKMIEMMYLGNLMQVNPFDQPNVELYKIETKHLLEVNE